jgi:hypothetical protein
MKRHENYAADSPYERALDSQLKAIRREDGKNKALVESEKAWAKKYKAAHPMKFETPQQHLDAHPITRHLRSTRISKKQLDGVRFRRRESEPFEQWATLSTADWPIKRLVDLRVWCTLRWLILENPPPSRDKDDAWKLIADYEARPIFEAGFKKANQFRNAQKTANEKREMTANHKVLSKFRVWEKRNASALRDEDQSTRAKLFLRTRPKSKSAQGYLSERERRRVRSLLLSSGQ